MAEGVRYTAYYISKRYDNVWVPMECQLPDLDAAFNALFETWTEGHTQPVAIVSEDVVEFYTVEDILHEWGYDVGDVGLCLDHGMPAPWCKCGEAA